AHALARANDGVFLLRHEDIDATRVRPEFYPGIETDLRWLGFGWDESPPLRQLSRTGAYEEKLETLRALGVVYPCFCTRREINEIAAPHGPEGPLYPGTCRKLSDEIRQEKLAAGAAHAWRLDAEKASQMTGPLTFTDLLHGEIEVDPFLLGDVVLARKDIGVAYHLAVVVDDDFQSITHVTRGEDLLSSTHVHRMLQKLLGLPEPVYLHHPLMLDENGKRLAKRHDALSIEAMRLSGLTPEDVLSKIQDPAVIRAITASMTSGKV
ncbi:MAG TPA: tRNA glutamyl-Q(34) synthetase GluQRS, partial [Luteolibacter sp.]|nr:tRNA glutamyl-Q(34) synthetase GluQRS [Luteolibacter sp.]